MGAATGCGSDSGPPLYLMHQHEARVGDQWFVMGGGCVEVDSCSGSAFGGGGESHAFSMTVNDSGGRLQVVIGSEVVVDRYYDRAFLESAATDKVYFELPDEGEQRYVIWGGPECEPVPPSDIDAYQQAREGRGS